MAKFITLLLALVLSSPVLAQSFSDCVVEAEARIAKLKEAQRLVASTIEDADAVEAAAQQTANPQQYIDFVVLRYERNNRKVQLAIVQAATEVVNNLSAFIGKDEVDQVVLREGIAKYSSMAAFSHKVANELQDGFFNHFSAYLNQYGYDCESVFRSDDMDLLLEYEIF